MKLDVFNIRDPLPPLAGLLTEHTPTIGSTLRDLFLRPPGQEVRLDSPASAGWLDNMADFPRLAELFSDRLAGKTLIDLGAGNEWQPMHEFAKANGVKTYVAVERYWERAFNSSWQGRTFPWIALPEEDGCQVILVKSDLLRFASALRSDSCCVTVNAIDSCVIPDVRYHYQLALELERIVPPRGLLFGIVSESLSQVAFGQTLSPAPQSANEMSDILERLPQLFHEAPANPRWIDHSPLPTDRVLEKRAEVAPVL